jgi:hypothetical protein
MNLAPLILILLCMLGCKAMDKKIIQESIAPTPRLQIGSRAGVAPATASITWLSGSQETLVWNYPDLSIVAGFNIYCGTNAGDCDQVISVGPVLQGTVADLIPNQPYYFAVTAFDDFNESDFSPELEAIAPQLLQLNFPETGSTLQASTDLVNWQPRAGQFANGNWTVRFHPDLPAEFFRVVTP